jgi:hypothetical protein
MRAIRANQESVQGAHRPIQIRAAKTWAGGRAAFQQITKPCLACVRISLRAFFGAPETELFCSFVHLLFIRLAANDMPLNKIRHRPYKEGENAVSSSLAPAVVYVRSGGGRITEINEINNSSMAARMLFPELH